MPSKKISPISYIIGWITGGAITSI